MINRSIGNQSVIQSPKCRISERQILLPQSAARIHFTYISDHFPTDTIAMNLQLNVQAPVFKLTDIFRRTVDLNEYRGKRILIGFFRHAGCPFCNLRVHALTKVHEQTRAKGMDMIFFFESKERVLLRSTFHQEVSPIPVLADPEKVWYARYGLEPSAYKSAVSHLTSFIQTAIKAKTQGVPVHPMADGESISTMPAEFLVDEGRVIRKLHYSQRLNDRMDLNEIVAFAESGK
jgi:peroxiredoxin